MSNFINYTGLTYDDIKSDIRSRLAEDSRFDNFRESALYSVITEIFAATTDFTNYYIERSFEYKQNGRVQNHEQALQKDKDYKELLDNNQIDYKYVNPNIKFISNIIEDILYKVKND
jgi:hypothetical protein